MRSYSNTSDVDFNRIPINKFWNSIEEKESNIHRIHSYPAKFPAFLTTKAIQFAKEKKMKPTRIADIFCGCGTVAIEARKSNIEFWGCDINPVATLIAEVKSEKYDVNLIENYYDNILKICENIIIDLGYENANERIKYWFDEKNYGDLFKLKRAILTNAYKNKKYKDFFLCAFSNILKASSRWLTKSIKPQVDPDKVPQNVFYLFEHQVEFMLNALKENPIGTFAKSVIKTNSILNKKLRPPKVDMIITSPPYVTSYEYADLHQLSSLWLEFTDNYTELRKGTIGSRYHLDTFDIENHKKKVNKIGQRIINRLAKKDKSKAKSVTRYFYDMQQVVKQSINMLNDGGICLFVIGNTEYKGVKINNAKHLYESMKDIGFRRFYITKRKITNKILTPYRDEEGKFTDDKNSRKIYSEEFIIIGKK